MGAARLEHREGVGEVVDEGGEGFGQLLKSSRGEAAEEVIVDELALGPDALDQGGSPGAEAKQDAAAIAGVGPLLDQVRLLQFARLAGDEGGADVKTAGDIADGDSAGVLVVGEDHRDVVLRGAEAEQRGEVGAGDLDGSAKGGEIEQHLAKAVVRGSALVEQFGAGGGQGKVEGNGGCAGFAWGLEAGIRRDSPGAGDGG